MALNKNFYAPTKTVKWNGEEVGTFNGISANDLALIMAEQTAQLELLVSTLEGDASVRKLDPKNSEEIGNFMQQNAGRLLSTLLSKLPELAASIIAVSAGEPDKADVVQTWPVPLQMEVLTEIAVLTFQDYNGFKRFLGNVMALVANLGGQRGGNSPERSSLEASDTPG